MSASDSYAVLAERLGFPGSQRLRSILEYLMTPDTARIVEALPGTVAEVAEKTGVEASDVRQVLDSLFFKGVVFPRGDYNQREYFRFARSTTQLHDASQSRPGIDTVKDRKLFALWHDFVMNEMYRRRAEDEEAHLKAAGRPHDRLIPAYKAIAGLPEVLPCEDYRELLKAQKRIAIVPCPCRYRTTAVGEHCDWGSEEERWACIQMNRAADYAITRGSGREVTYAEAMELVDKMEEDGLLHMWRNSNVMSGPHTSCNCCRDCCIIAVPMDKVGLPLDHAWDKSRFAAYTSSLDACNGCQDCVDRCPFEAIEMTRVAGSKKMKAMVDEEKCFGCGVCVVGCQPKALAMRVVRPPEYIPVAAVAGE